MIFGTHFASSYEYVCAIRWMEEFLLYSVFEGPSVVSWCAVNMDILVKIRGSSSGHINTK
jgi:hypothetical protein